MHFRNIIGHQKQLERLTADLESGNLAHAYLLAGPADLGKFTIAKNFAKAIQTQGLDEEALFNLNSQIDRGIHLDTMIVPRSLEEETIKIATVRSLLNNLQMTGVSRQRILVMEDIDRLTPEAANAMLKMIEEPPSKVLYLFTSSNPNQILETILSRVRRIDFSVLDEQTMNKGLTNRYRLLDQAQLNKVVELSMGRIAKAIKLLDNQETMEAYENIYREIREFLERKDISQAFAFIGQIHSDNLLTQIFLEIAAVVLREDLKKATSSQQTGSKEAALKRLEKLFEILKFADTNVNNRLLLENFILSL
jgi:DNA polymerase III gamma/tau subunit